MLTWPAVFVSPVRPAGKKSIWEKEALLTLFQRIHSSVIFSKWLATFQNMIHLPSWINAATEVVAAAEAVMKPQ
jgi:hypothetical protein